ncbi:MAG: DUF2807 domain-containing protein [Pelobium sp.]
MKNSNKLLITLATLFFIVPLMGMMVISKLYYKVNSTSDYLTTQVLNNQPFKEKTKGRTSIVINEPFNAVNIVNANNSSIELHLNQDENYGVKIQDDFMKDLDFKVENGVLNIFFKNGLSIDNYANRIMINTYAPKFKKISAFNTAYLNLVSLSDSLNINLRDCNYFSIGYSAITTAKVVNGDTTNHEPYNKTQFKNLNINLDKSTLKMNNLNLEHLNIKAQNNSTVEMESSGINANESTIEHFNLNTLGKNEVKIKNFNFKEAKGEISDETKLEAPISILKQLFKN